MEKKILVMGAGGLLGSTFVRNLKKNSSYKLITHSLKKKADYLCDVTEYSLIFDLISKIKPNVIINLIGLTSVELCQNNANLAYLLNCKTVKNIVDAIKNIGLDTHLIHISTDHVYDGAGPHREDGINIINNYAFSKYTGELIAEKIDSSIIRTNFIGKSLSHERESMSDWIYNSLEQNKKISVFDDVKFSPLSMSTVSKYIETIIEKKPIGIFNLGSHNGMSKADFDFIFAEMCSLNTSNMARMSVDDVSWDMAIRPKDMRMNLDKIQNTLSIELPDLVTEIELIVKDYI